MLVLGSGHVEQNGAVVCLVSFLTGTGHVTPLLPIATAARAAGHEVGFAGPAVTLPIIESAGFRGFAAGVYRSGTPEEAAVAAAYRAHPTIAEAEAVLQRMAFAGFRPRRTAADLRRVLAEWEPDAIVREETDFGAAFAAERAGLPHGTVHILAAGSYLRPELIAGQLNECRVELGLPLDRELAALDRYLVLSPFPPGFPPSRFPAAADRAPPGIERRDLSSLRYVVIRRGADVR